MAFNQVRLSCFGDELEPEYQARIAEFEEAFQKLDKDVFPAAHICFHHLPDFCAKYGSCGPWSEQSFESIHYKWMEFWERSYKRSMDAKDYASQLEKAIKDFNTLAVGV